MKKRFSFLLALLFILSLTACAQQPEQSIKEDADAAEITAPIEATEVQEEDAPQPTEEIQPTENPEPSVGDPMDSTLEGTRSLGGESLEAMAENDAGHWGGGVKGYNAETGRVEFPGSASGCGSIRLNEPLGSFSDQTNQAIRLVFQYSGADNFNFAFMDKASPDSPPVHEFGIDFSGGTPKLYKMLESAPPMESFEGNMVLSPDTWYVLLMAIDSKAEFRAVIWEQDNPQNQLIYQEVLPEDFAGISWTFSNWWCDSDHLIIIDNYEIFTFDHYVE